MSRMRRTYTFDFWTGWPKWRSYSFTPEPIRWLWFRWFDFVPLVLVLALADYDDSALLSLTALWYFVCFPIVVWRRLEHRRRVVCGAVGHVPYRPDPREAPDVWECLRCALPLDADVYATERMRDLREHYRRDDPPQSFYSDRR